MPYPDPDSEPSWSYDQVGRTYTHFIGGSEVPEAKWKRAEAKWYAEKAKAEGAGRFHAQFAIKPAVDTGWEYENGGRGREVTQFHDPSKPPGAGNSSRYFRSQREAIEAGKRAGYSVERAR